MNMTYFIFSLLVAFGMTISEIEWRRTNILEILLTIVIMFPLHFIAWPALMGATFVKIKRNLK